MLESFSHVMLRADATCPMTVFDISVRGSDLGWSGFQWRPVGPRLGWVYSAATGGGATGDDAAARENFA
ncbi:hypothetical protein [Albirhodobacter sp. R86504]|uniref:hypothetical protein n=1 Tax=Albirhodobacter sp. R86504 TaxID=3093848 RepID=UPI0036715034